jgi:type II secretory pathway pseudopilin PulG
MLAGKNNYQPSYQYGFTYMGLMMIIAISGIAMAGVGIVWQQDMQREREKELLFIGEQYRTAIGSYYENSPTGAKQFPASLQDLLVDNRGPTIKHHIRKLYLDPFMRDKDWDLILQESRIIGVRSNSKLAPIKKTGFASYFDDFSEAASYNDWRFFYTPGSNPVSLPITN